MAIRVSQNRSVAPLILGGALALLGLVPSGAPSGVTIERVRVNPARDPAFLLESLEGMGAEGARRVLSARGRIAALDAPEGLLSVPGVGARLLHRWHEDLASGREAR